MAVDVTDESHALGLLFHRLNNQFGIILANAEILEKKGADYFLSLVHSRTGEGH